MRKQNILLQEFLIRVYADGRVDYGGFDSFLWWWLHRRSKESLLPFEAKIAGFGQQVRAAKKKR